MNLLTFFLESISSRQNFVTTVNKFYDYANSKSVNNHPIQRLFSSEKYSPEVFDRLEYDLLVVLEQMTYGYTIKSPESILSEQYKLLTQVNQALKLSNYVTALCLKIPRCLDFLFARTQNHLNVYWLYKMHRTICQTLPELYTDNIVIDVKNVRAVSVLYKEFMAFQEKANLQKFWTSRKDYEEKSTIFISSLYSIIDVIDKKPKFLKFHLPAVNIFDDKEQDLSKITISAKNNNNSEQILQLNDRLKNINIDYTDNIINKCGASIGSTKTNDVDVPIPVIVNKLLLYTFQRIEKHFVLSGPLNPSKMYVITVAKNYKIIINVDTSIIFEKLCNHVPLILLYLAENNFHDTHQLFSYYFTFCGDYEDFLFTRCPVVASDINGLFDFIHCISKPVTNILKWNFYTLTKTISENDGNINMENCRALNLKYIQNVYEAVSECYNKNNVDVWSTFNWLSGKYFFTDEEPCISIGPIKDALITVNGKQMTLAEVYYLILPWNLNTNTILLFHNFILNEAHKMVVYYVYMHARLIMLYVEDMKNEYSIVDQDDLENVRDSFMWFKTSEHLFNKYLGLPIYNIDQTQIYDIVYQIQSIYNTDKTCIASSAIPKNDDDFISKWLHVQFDRLNEESHKSLLKKLLLNNCEEAMDFFIAFNLIAKKSMGQEVNNNHIQSKLHCFNYISKVFE